MPKPDTKPTDAIDVLDNAIAERRASTPAVIDDAPHNVLMTKSAKAFATNFAGDQLQMFQHISHAKNGEHKKLLDAVNEELELELWYAHEVEFFNTEGELVEARRIVLFTTAGDSYECVSDGVFDFLTDCVAVYGYRPWQPPLRVKVVQRKTRNWRMLTLLPLAPKEM